MEAELAGMARALGNRPTLLRVGFLEGATYPNGLPVALVAFWNNYGTSTAPPRPFFSNMVRDRQSGWPRAIALNLRAQNFDARKALNVVGQGIAGQLRQSIKDTNSPALAPSTIAKRKAGMTAAQIKRADARSLKTGAPPSYAKPLVDTGIMLGSVDSEVV